MADRKSAPLEMDEGRDGGIYISGERGVVLENANPTEKYKIRRQLDEETGVNRVSCVTLEQRRIKKSLDD